MVNFIFNRLLRQISVRTRMIGSFLLIMFLAGAIAPVILYNLNSLKDRLKQTTNVDGKIERLLLLSSQRVAVSEFNLNRYIQGYTSNPYEAIDNTNQARQGLIEAKALMTNVEKISTVQLIIRSLETYRQQITELQKAHVTGNATETARLQSQLQNLGNDITVRLESVVNQNVADVAAANEEVLSDAQQATNFGFVMMFIGPVLAIIFSTMISISITTPLAELRASTEAFQQGQMETTINVTGADEFTVIARIFNDLTQQVYGLITGLENRVAGRTTELNTAIKYIERRAKQFEAITKVSQSISTSTSLQDLLPYISQVVSEQFGFYHVGIFLNDPSTQYAILAAANSPGGKRMLQRGHQLRIGEQGIVGYVTSTGKPRIALDVGQDVVFFTNPDLPETHSEMALPLRIAGKIAGALDIQSTESNAFSNDDVEVLSALAEQVSLAIQNARLFDQTKKTLAEAEAIQRQYLRETWRRLPQEERFSGFRYSALGATLIGMNEEVDLTGAEKKHTEIAVPIDLRGETIGSLIVRAPRNERVTADQMDIIKSVAERVALSAENARLFDETTRRAERERIVSDISAKIGSSFQTESILRTTAQELSNLLESADIVIKLQPPQNPTADK